MDASSRGYFARLGTDDDELDAHDQCGVYRNARLWRLPDVLSTQPQRWFFDVQNDDLLVGPIGLRAGGIDEKAF